MYEFTKIERISPALRPSNERIHNFSEIQEQYTEEETAAQASRCVQCGNPYCSSTGCPLGNYIPQWLKFIAEKDLKLAFDLSNETSPFPEILGRICPHSRLCEGACTLNDGNELETIGAITIGSIEVAISEQGFQRGFSPEFAKLLEGKSVGIIGSGPAGISCAHFLLRAGIKPVVYERSDKAGGLLTYGIPNFKLEKEAVERRIALLEEAGMELRLNTEVGKDISFEEIHREHNAVFLAMGALQGRVLDADSYNTPNLFMAIPFLTNAQKQITEQPYDKKYNVRDKRVLVIGGGDTAMDCVRTSLRLGASQVQCLYRRDEENMPGSRKEFLAAKEEGVQFIFQKSPKRLLADENGLLVGAEFIDTQLIPQEQGRDRIEEITGTEQIWEADVIILALGFSNERLPFLEKNDIQINEWGAIYTDENQQTTKAGVFAGGDGVRGADLAVTAALDGREAALKIIEYVLG
ncbi:MAG: glutamate synthase subunit beta [Bacteroidota bacterium]